MDQALFQTRLSRSDYFFAVTSIVLGVTAIICFVSNIPVLGAVSLPGAMLSAIQAITSSRVFLVYREKLVVRMPLTMIRRTDVSYPVGDITEVMLSNTNRRFKRPVITVKCRKRDHGFYVFQFPKETLAAFVDALSKVGVNVTYEKKPEYA
jgi:hypothetical protein